MAAVSLSAPSPAPFGASKNRNGRRSSDPLPPRRSGLDGKDGTRIALDGRQRTKSSRDFEVPKPSVLGSDSSRRRRSDGGAVAHHRNTSKNTLEIQRGVRPQLDQIQCPVTKKTLMDDVLTVQGDDGCNDASLASTSISSSTTNDDPSHGDDSTAEYSDSDIGLNHSDFHDQTSKRKHEKNRNRTSNSHRASNYVDGRKAIRAERETDKSLYLSNSPNRRQRRLPKHYNNIPETMSDRGRSAKHTNSHRDSRSKDSDKKQSRSKSASRQNPQGTSKKLSTEVAQFQKMVADLQAVSCSSASSPEAMWKTRILLRSARDAERDLKLSLNMEKQDAGAKRSKSVAAAALAASRKKLLRDYHRASEQLRLIVEETERRQRAEISCLTASEAAAAGMNAEGEGAAAAQKRALLGAAQAEEDFFDRAMRERQAEVQKISDGMKKVQEIYTDLAGLVDGQQEQIDKLEDINEDVKAHTRAGLEEIQHGMWKLCVADQHKNDGIGAKNMDESRGGPSNRQRKKKVLDPSEILNCMMACQGHSESPGDGRRGVLSLDDELSHERNVPAFTPQELKEINANYYSDDVQVSELGWNLPNLEDVQESAQDAYERGHAIVGDLVGQVHDVVATGEFRDIGNRFSCTPQPEEISLGGYNDDDSFEGVGIEEVGTAKESAVENYSREDLLDKKYTRHRIEDRHRRHRSRRSSSSHSH